MTAESPASEVRDIGDPNDASGARLPRPLDEEARQRGWQALMDEYQAEHGAFTEEERSQARQDLFG